MRKVCITIVSLSICVCIIFTSAAVPLCTHACKTSYLPLYLCVYTHVKERLAALLKRTEPLEAVALARRRKSDGGGDNGGGGGGGTARFVDGGTGHDVSGGNGLVERGDEVVGSGAGAVNGGAGAVYGVARGVADCIENSADALDIPSSPKV